MKQRSVYECEKCGFVSAKWLGRCTACGSWDSFFEREEETAAVGAEPKKHRALVHASSAAQLLSETEVPEYFRTSTGCGEFDRVLGGGLVSGSVVLLSGEPGIGKSTLLMQVCTVIAKGRKVLYISGEESTGQLKLRAQRLGVTGEGFYIYTGTDLDKILEEAKRLSPDFIVVDSIQTLYSSAASAAPGSISQVRECAMAFVSKAKADGCAVMLVGHVNKEGGISGPKVLEHIVDAVLHFEGDRMQAYRIIRAVKNRFGSTNEIGVFEMTDKGLSEVENPSLAMLSEATEGASGCCAVCVMEGTRPIIVEIQALVTPTVFPSPRRNANGVDYNRLCLILAVLEKRLGLKFYQNDVHINVTGGMRLDTPTADVAIALALISSITDRPVKEKMLAFGELGLAGECRSALHANLRIGEGKRLGMKTFVVPKKNAAPHKDDNDINVCGVSNVYELLRFLKKPEEKQ